MVFIVKFWGRHATNTQEARRILDFLDGLLVTFDMLVVNQQGRILEARVVLPARGTTGNIKQFIYSSYKICFLHSLYPHVTIKIYLRHPNRTHFFSRNMPQKAYVIPLNI